MSSDVRLFHHSMSLETADCIIDRKVLVAVLPDERGAFDIGDQFQCYAFMWLRFECCTCGREETFADDDYPGMAWIVSAAGRARCDGWRSAGWSFGGILDGPLTCPECSQRPT